MRMLAPLLLTGCAPLWFDGRTWNCDSLGAADAITLVAPGGLRLDEVADDNTRCRVHATGPSFPTPGGGGLNGVSDARLTGADMIEATWGDADRRDLGGTRITFALDYTTGPQVVTTIIAGPSSKGYVYWDESTDVLDLTVDCDHCEVATYSVENVDLELGPGSWARICGAEQFREDGEGTVTRFAASFYEGNPCIP